MSDTGFNSTSGGLRTWVIKNSALVVVVAVVVVVFALGAFGPMHWWGPRPPRPPEWAWYAVEGTQEFVVDRADQIPPIVRDGKVLVRAQFFGCGDCGEANRFVAYYWKYSDELKVEVEQLRAELERDGESPSLPEIEDGPLPESVLKGSFISINNKTWYLQHSVEGEQLLDHVFDKCPSRKFVRCDPQSARGWH